MSPEERGRADRAAEQDWERRRRLDAVFGDVLPTTTVDEREPGGGSPATHDPNETWLKEQVPPHHGG